MQKGGERIPGIEEARTTSPCPCAYNFPSWGWIPKGNLKDSGRIISHDFSFQAKVLQDLQRSRLDAIRSARGSRYRPVVDVPDAVPPSCETYGEKKAHWPRSNDDNIVLGTIFCHSRIDSERES